MLFISRKNFALKTAVLLIAVCILMTSCSRTAVKVTDYKDFRNASSLHSHSDGEIVARDGDYLLLFDKNTTCISVKNSNNGFVWKSLSDGVNGFACILKIEVIYNSVLYFLNSQDNSVAFSYSESEKNDNGICVKYGFAVDENSGIICTAYVDYVLKNGELSVSARFENKPETKIIIVDLLPFFGSKSEPQTGDYFIIPDGCGAVMYTSGSDSVTNTVTLPVYGGDSSLETENKTCIFPVFCEKDGDNGFSAVVCEGDSLCSITATRKNDGQPARVYPEFKTAGYGINDDKITVSDVFQQNIKVVYKFITVKNTDYSAFASTVRELLISNGFLSGSRVEKSDCRLNVSVIGYSKNGSDTRVAGFSDIKTLSGLLKGKGVKNINLFCRGFLSGGLNQKSINTSSVSAKTGGKKSLSDLYDYTSSNNIDLFVCADLISAGDSGFSLFNTAKAVNGKKATVKRKNQTYVSDGDMFFERELLKADGIFSASLKLKKLIEALDCDGVCISDVGEFIYSDCVNGFNCENVKCEIEKSLDGISRNGLLCVEKGNAYTLKNADFILNLPDGNSVSGGGYECIPFVQTVLHGYVNYSLGAMNLSESGDYILKCAEYGAFPYYEWDFAENGNLYYGNTVNDAVESYESISRVLAGLSDSVMVSHRRLSDGVFASEYENGVTVYVNYNDCPVTADMNITVNAKSVLKTE